MFDIVQSLKCHEKNTKTKKENYKTIKLHSYIIL